MNNLVLLLVGAFLMCVNGNGRILVVSDNAGIYISHSIFFSELRQMGFKLEYKNIQSILNLQVYGEWQYDSLVIFASAQSEIKAPEKDILDFFDSGRNILLLGTLDQSRYFRRMFNSFGLDMHERGLRVQDYFNNVNGDPDVVTSRNVNVIHTTKEVAYSGAGLAMTPYETNQVYGFVKGSESAVSGSVYSHNIIYVGATQGRNNARFVGTGGQELFSNEYLVRSELGNSELMRNTVRWCFGQMGILKVENVMHRRVESNDVNPQNYRVSEDIHFECEIYEWDYLNNTWVAYIADDILLEFVMLDPYYRIPLKQQNGALYSVEFRTPDKYGVFQFKIKYEKPGYTFLKVAEKVTVRPYRHDEYPRYLVQALPYYVSSFATIGGFVIFLMAFLFNK